MPLYTLYGKASDTLGTDTTLIPDPQTFLQIPLTAFAANWLEIRVAISMSMTTDANNNGGFPASGDYETLAGGGLFGRSFSAGFKDSSIIPPGVAGSRFIGKMSRFDTADRHFHVQTGPDMLFDACSAYGDSGYDYAYVDGVTLKLVGPGNVGISYPPHATMTGSLNYNTVHQFRLRLSNRGTTFQKIVFAAVTNSNVNMAANSVALLRPLLDAPPAFTHLETDWTTGGVALPPPDTFWYRMPFTGFRFRVHAFIAKKYLV